ncbi:hypothetical protein RMSM_01287 [Rhodopirellula maiorica SM1]|uniref:Uncharacterized protein n=1 Tax=Rhodopirellula maiorica SM1 TaxID=1265738 RepID=M5S6J5_9BACT|nr:hypothetical protein RMSM_01287 [Rhodopirellula maiorica SM1]
MRTKQRDLTHFDFSSIVAQWLAALRGYQMLFKWIHEFDAW